MFAPKIASAASAGDVVKSAASPAVYYFGSDGKRYVFPNAPTYFTWYADFAAVKTVSADELASMPIGGDVTYRPGTRLVKIQTDPKVYAVSKGGVLRHVVGEAVARCLLGGNWNAQIDDVPDAFFVDYRVGAPVVDCGAFDVGAERLASPTIGVDKGLEEASAGPLPETPTFSLAPPPFAPAAGQEGTLMELRLRTASSVRVRQLPVRLDALFGAPTPGQGEDADLGGLVRGANARLNVADVRWVNARGDAVFGALSPALDDARDQQQTLEFGGSWDVPAGSDVKLRLVARFDSEIPSGEEFRAVVPVARVAVDDASGAARSFLPAIDLVAPTVAVGKRSFEMSAAPIPDKDVQVRGAADVPLAAFVFRASSAADSRVASVRFQTYVDEQEGVPGFLPGGDADDGTETRASDLISSVRLTDADGRTVAGPVAMPFDGRPAFSAMSLTVPAGTGATYVLRGDLRRDAAVGAHDDRVSFDVADLSRDVVVTDPSGAAVEALGVTPNGGAAPRYALTVREHGGLAFAWAGAEGTVVAGREAPLGTLKISAAHDVFDVSALTFALPGDDRATLASMRLAYVDAQGTTRDAAATFSGNDAMFTGLALRIPRDASVTASVYVRVAATTDKEASGDVLRASLAADRPMIFSSVAEARAFGGDDIGGAFTLASAEADLRVRLTALEARRSASTPTGVVARGRAVEVLRFELTTAPEGPARLEKLAFRLKPGDVAFEGAANDALERWSDVDGDAADDNDVIELRRMLASGYEVLGEDASAAIRYGIVRNGVADMTPHGLVSAYGDEGYLEIVFAADQGPYLAAGTTTVFTLGLKTDDVAQIADATLETRLLDGADFVWADVTDGYHVPRTGDEVPGTPLVSPLLTLP